MLLAIYVLIILSIMSWCSLVIAVKSDGVAAGTLQAIFFITSLIISIISLIGLIGSLKIGKIYRSEYDKLIQHIDTDKTKVFKEDDEITDIYITVNGEEYHFKFKEENSNE